MMQESVRLRTTARREEIDWVHSESVQEIVPMQDTDESVDSTSKVLVLIMMSVSLSNKRKTIEVETPRHQQSTFPRTAQRLIYIRLPAEDRQKYDEDQFGRLIKSMHGTQDASHIWRLGCANRICGESGSFRRGKHSAALFHNPNQDVAWQMQGDNFECLLDDGGLKHIHTLLISKDAVNDMENTWIQRFKLEQSCVVELWIQSSSGLN